MSFKDSTLLGSLGRIRALVKGYAYTAFMPGQGMDPWVLQGTLFNDALWAQSMKARMRPKEVPDLLNGGSPQNASSAKIEKYPPPGDTIMGGVAQPFLDPWCKNGRREMQGGKMVRTTTRPSSRPASRPSIGIKKQVVGKKNFLDPGKKAGKF